MAFFSARGPRSDVVQALAQDAGGAALAELDQIARGALASVLLAAGVAALVVLADHLMEAWAERHEIAAWLALWGVAVLAIVLLRGLSRVAARRAMGALDAWSARVAQRRADERLWHMAQTDTRLMADLKSALDRSGEQAPSDVVELSQRRAARILRERLYYL